MISDLERLQRIRDIPDTAVKQIDTYTFNVSAQSDKHGEVIYSIFYSDNQKKWFCTCKDYLYRNTEETPDYECKHIGKVRDLLLRRLSK